jgi:uncharacterized protein with PIN domain
MRRLLFDRMLAGLARWARAAGHDAALAGPGESDAMLVERCRREARALVTRNRRLAAKAAPAIAIVLLEHDEADAQAIRLAQAVDLDWTLAPFTRCMMDNAELAQAGPAELARMPGRTREFEGPFRSCPACGRVYWPGSHARRMLARLTRWRELAALSEPR